MTDARLQASRLTVGYASVPVVRELDLHVRPGEVVALFGPNGAGKTTTVMALAGLLPVMSGDVRFLGAVSRDPLHVRARRGMGLVTERRALAMSLSVGANLRIAGVDADAATALFPELGPRLGERAGLLSGGLQQMVAVARAIGRRPSVLLIDELSLGLAPLVVDRLLSSVRAAADGGTGVLLVEQHIGKALQIADRVMVLSRGRLVLEGPAPEYRDRVHDIVDAYLTGGGSAQYADVSTESSSD